MRLVTNRVEPNQVRETDSAYIIEDVPFVRPMELSGGYVPRENIKQTANQWAGVPATMNHPRNEYGEPVAADSQPNTHLGQVTNVSFDGEYVRGDMRIDKRELDTTDGGDKLQSAIQSGDPISVSSQYAAAPADPGEYDGEYRDNVERIIRPDSVAILPDQPGKCSIQDGCGINPQMVANSDLTIPMTHTGEAAVTQNMDVPQEYQFDNPGEAASAAQELGFEGAGDELIHTHGEGDNTVFMPGPSHDALLDTLMEMDEMSANQEFELTDVSPSDVDAFTDAEWDGSAATAAMPNPSDDEDAPAVLDMAHLVRPSGEEARQDKTNWKLPFREGPDAPANTRALVAAKAALEGARGGVEGLSGDMQERIIERINDMLVNAPDDLFGSMSEEMESESGHMEMEENVLTRVANAVAGVLGGGSSGTSAAESERNETTPAESGTDSQSTMEDEDKIDELAANTAFDRENLVKWDGTECLSRLHEQHIEANDMTDNNDNPAVTFDTEEEFEQRVSEIVANREAQSKKEELASEIVANSAEYDDAEAVKEDYPTVAALETKQESLQSTQPAMPGRGTQVANSGEEEEFPDMEIGGEF